MERTGGCHHGGEAERGMERVTGQRSSVDFVQLLQTFFMDLELEGTGSRCPGGSWRGHCRWQEWTPGNRETPPTTSLRGV